ncbi:unnamed protein product [Cylicostephanus goldi]|uniref:PDZ domain-containing protein n=1 Tax=Cylicostephanus goldi TaxID=71465 RepID=A0A3P7N9N7_CYLGO|nr:unnamed protein product [Cylicostephanus goldi]
MSSRYETIPTTANSSHMANGVRMGELVRIRITTNGHQHSPQNQHIKTRQPVIPPGGSNPYFTRDPNQLRGEMVTTTITKGAKGLGFTLIGNDASSKGDEFIQVIFVIFNLKNCQIFFVCFQINFVAPVIQLNLSSK